MKAVVNFNNYWNDQSSNARLLSSDKSIEVKKASIENILKNTAMRFERSPNTNTLSLWAGDLAETGINIKVLEQICSSIPKRFERFPSYAEISAIIKPHILTEDGLSESRLDKASREAYPLVKARFIKMADEAALTKMVAYYKREVIKENEHFTCGNYEMCMLFDWLRSYFSADPKKIVAQGQVSNIKAQEGDVEYFLKPLERFLNENNKPRDRDNNMQEVSF